MKNGKKIVSDILGKDKLDDYIDTQSLVLAVRRKYPRITLAELARKVNAVGKYGTMQNQARPLTASDVSHYLNEPGHSHEHW